MKTLVIFPHALLRWLILPVLLIGFLLSAQTARAAGPCSGTNLHGGSISADETWCASDGLIHSLGDTVTVQRGVTLTIEAGVTVDWAEANWSQYVIVLGHLDVNGTAAKPVLLTRSINYPNQNWGGLFFDGSQGDGSGTINYATIQHAGANFLPPGCAGVCGNGQTAVFVKDLAPGKQVRINHSTITDNVNKGLFVVDSTVAVNNTTFSNNKMPIHIVGSTSALSYSGNTFHDNAYPYYYQYNYTIQQDLIFLGADALTGQDFDLPAQNGLDAYVYPAGATIPPGTTMTVQPGVTLRTEWSYYISVQGRLEAEGTPELPILFSSMPRPDANTILYWGGLYFDGTQGNGSGSMRHASIEYGGANNLPPGCSGTCGNAQTALFVKDVAADRALNVSYSTIRDSLGKGLFAVDSPGLHFDNNRILAGRIGADIASNLTVSNLALVNQQLDALIVESGYNVDARHLTIAGAGRSGFHVYANATGLLRNSILSHNLLAVWAEGSGQANLDTNLADANTTFKNGSGTLLSTIHAPAAFKPDGYHIQTTSYAAGAGLPGLCAVDIDGDARPGPAGSRPDIGADEVETGAFRLFFPFLTH
jgi:hypothetical protein